MRSLPVSLLDRLRLSDGRAPMDLDATATTHAHAEIIVSKPFLRQLYEESYRVFARAADRAGPGVFVELGSGGGFLKNIIPEVTTSDIVPLPGVDACFRAEAMPFADGSIAGLFLLDCFHHIPQPEAALSEFVRVLRPGGIVVMVEPANTPWSRFVYTRFHHEDFDPAADWGIMASGRLSAANGALPWIVFIRDRQRFESRFPGLRVKRITLHTPFRRLASGGLSFRQLAPSWSFGLLTGIEWMLSPLSGMLGMFMTVELERR
jgi:SAM-dependent methyltransferase